MKQIMTYNKLDANCWGVYRSKCVYVGRLVWSRVSEMWGFLPDDAQGFSSSELLCIGRKLEELNGDQC